MCKLQCDDERLIWRYNTRMQDSSRDYHVTIKSGTIVRIILLLVLLFALYYLSDVLLVVVAAVIIASSVEPILRRLQRHKVHRVVGAISV